jgi:DNA polymerase-3 subunit alpha
VSEMRRDAEQVSGRTYDQSGQKSKGQGFVHLRVHSEYSIVDSVIRLPALAPTVSKAGMPAVALTDKNNLFGLVKFYKSALQAGIKPIVGADVLLEDTAARDGYAALVLLARNETGYLNLKCLITLSYTEGKRNGIPVIQQEWLKKHSEGLIALSGGREGVIGQLLLDGKKPQAEKLLRRAVKQFAGDFYLELERTGRPGEEDYIKAAVALAAKTECPVVATNDVRFLRQDEFEAHEARTCIQSGYVLDDTSRPRLYSEQQYLRTPEEMSELFADLPEALENTVEIAKRCTVPLELGKSVLPDYEIPTGDSPAAYLERVAKEGLEGRLANRELTAAERKIYDERLQRELGVINEMGFPGYFLIVADFIRWAKENGVPVGPGRGSGAGSVVAWAMGITDLDPLQFDLLFERFLNPERVSMPDFDIDFCMEGRDRVIEYVGARYGRDRVAQIITYNSMAAKAVVRDVSRVMGHPYGFADRIARLIPPTPGMTLQRAFEEEPELGELCDNDDDVQALMDLARQLEGLPKSAGTHAGGVVISPSALTDFAPLFKLDDATGAVTQFDMKDVESVGLVKFDFLGLRTLTIIDKALATINAARVGAGASEVDLETIPMDDPKAYALLQSAQTHAVFQLESRGMRDLIKRLKPDCFEDIVALVALFRPGPLQSGMVDTFIERKHGGDKVQIDFLHPDLEPVLANTYGVILYQEQVMQTAQILAGYSLGQADLLRRAMGKKIAEEMGKQRSIFVDGAVNNGVEEKTAAHIFDLMEKFAEYGFNKSHSAAYALLAYQTAWLKAHFPEAFMAAVLSADMEYTDKLKLHHRECLEMGLGVLRPNVNKSETSFTVAAPGEISYGLGALKGLGRQAADAIVAEREANGPYQDIHDFCRRLDTQKINKRAVESLIKAGGMDAFGANRPSLLADLPFAMGGAEQYARAQAAGQNDMFGAEAPPLPPAEASALPKWSARKFFLAEYEALGLFLSGHPFDQYRADVPYVCTGTIGSVIGGMQKPAPGGDSWRGGTEVTLAGLITDIKKRGNRVTMTLDDGRDRIELTMFSEAYHEYRHLLEDHAGRIVCGKIRYDDYIDGWRVSVNEVKDIDRVIEQKASRLVIHWLERDAGGLDTNALREILEPYRPGRCAVSLLYRNGNAQARLQFDGAWRVRPSGELREKLAEAIGINSFRFGYGKSA